MTPLSRKQSPHNSGDRKELIPYDEVRKNDNIILGTHPCAGHGSYYTGLKPKSWYQYPVIDFFAALDKLSRQQ